MENKNTIFTWKIGGEAGSGQQSAGAIFSKIVARRGYYTFGYSEFPSIIRGGHVTYAVSLASRPISAIYKTVNLLLALNDDTVKMHINELSDDGVLIFDSSSILEEDVRKASGSLKHILYGLPIEELIEKNNLKKIVANIIFVGASLGLLEFDIKAADEVIDQIFKRKGEEVQAMNRRAIEVGYRFAQDHFHPEKYVYYFKNHKN